MDGFSLTASQKRTAKKREKKKRRQQAKGTLTAHPPPTRPSPLSSAAVLREQSESSGDDEDNGPDKAEEKQPEESTLAEDVIESLALHAPDTLPEAPSEPDSRAPETLASHKSESLRWAHVQLEKCLNNGTDPPAWLLEIVMRPGSTSSREASKYDHVSERAVETHSETTEVDLTAAHSTNAASDPPPSKLLATHAHAIHSLATYSLAREHCRS